MKSNYLYENFMEDNILACYLRVSDEDFDLKQIVEVVYRERQSLSRSQSR